MGKSEKPMTGQTDYTETLPLVEEQAEIVKHRHVEAKVQVSRTTHIRQEELSSELMQEEVHIKHVPLNRRLADEDIPKMRQEGDVLIIPVIEEEVEIVRRKVLKEEIHILKNTTSEKYTQEVTLRHQEVTITKDEN